MKCIDISRKSFDEQPTMSELTVKDFSKIDKMDYQDFFSKYLLTNTPCLLSSNHTSSWPSKRDWVRFDCEKRKLEPDLEAIHRILKEDYLVPVSDCDTKECLPKKSPCRGKRFQQENNFLLVNFFVWGGRGMRDQVITSFFLLNEKSKEKMINFLKTNDMFIYL